MKNLQIVALFMLCGIAYEAQAKEAQAKMQQSEKVPSVKRDERILREHMEKFADKAMTHHELNSFVYRIECYARDLKKHNNKSSEQECKMKKEAIAFAQAKFKELAKDHQYENLEKRIKALK